MCGGKKVIRFEFSLAVFVENFSVIDYTSIENSKLLYSYNAMSIYIYIVIVKFHMQIAWNNFSITYFFQI